MEAQQNRSMVAWQIWWLAIRPKTLPASAAGVVMGSALAWANHAFQLLPALAALCVAVLLQIGSNVANDVYDFERGADQADRQGPLRVTQAGLMTPAQMKRGLVAIFSAAILIGLYLAYLRGWPVIVLGAAAMLAAIAYTGGPFPLAYYGLGDIMVFVFFGLLSVAGSYYVETGTVGGSALLMSIPVGLLITDILVVNNLRDLQNDRLAGKRTMAVRVGAFWTRAQYVLFGLLAYLVVPLWIWQGTLPVTALAVWFSLPLAWRSTHTVLTQRGRPLNAALAGTGIAALAYSILFFLGMLLSRG